MRDAKRIKTILDKLKRVWEKQPDTRLGQLLSILPENQRDIFYLEDDELEKMLDELLRQEEK
jgi:uncharacterized protein YihD (DUF1040 family)